MANNVEESIMLTIKKMVVGDICPGPFDLDILTHINSVFMTLQQLGVGPNEGFLISGPDEKWSDFAAPAKMLQAVQSYMYLAVRILFDPPSSSYVMTAMKEERTMLEYRLREQAHFFNSEIGEYKRQETGDS